VTFAVTAMLAIGGLTACEVVPDLPTGAPTASTTTTTAPAETPGERAVMYARSEIGTPYLWGGRTPGVGFDCSGLTSWAWEQAGTMIPRVSRDQYAATKRITRSELRAGDLVFYAADGITISHVGMYAGDGDIIVQTRRSSTTGVTEDSLSTWWTSALVGYGRVTVATS
jgi:cell wall-associated NlpC family hydrolase